MKIAVVGAGIVGTSIAFSLQAAGHMVTIFDHSPPGEGGPSRGNAGHIAASDIFPLGAPNIASVGLRMLMDPYGPLKISPSYFIRLLPWLLQFLRTGTEPRYMVASKAMQRLSSGAVEATEALFSRAHIRDMIKRVPALYVYETEASLEKSRVSWDLKARAGHACEFVSSSDLSRLEPALADVFSGGVLSFDWAQVGDPLVVVRRLFESARSIGVIYVRTQVDAIADNGGAVVLRTMDGRSQKADIAIVAAGLGSKFFASALGERLPVEAEAGYNVTYQEPGIAVERPVVFADRGMVSTTLASGLRIGGWAEFAGPEAQPSAKYFSRIEELGQCYFPGLRVDAGIRWSGKRPTMPDSVPVISRSNASRRIIYATGHGHYGLTWAAQTADIVSQMVSTEGDFTEFSIKRFN